MLTGDYSSTNRKCRRAVYCCIFLICYITQEDKIWKTQKVERSHDNIMWDTYRTLCMSVSFFPSSQVSFGWKIAMYSQSLNSCQLKFLHQAPWLSVPPRQIRPAPTPHLSALFTVLSRDFPYLTVFVFTPGGRVSLVYWVLISHKAVTSGGLSSLLAGPIWRNSTTVPIGSYQ